MSSEQQEALELSTAISALVVNLGTLRDEQIQGMLATCTLFPVARSCHLWGSQPLS